MMKYIISESQYKLIREEFNFDEDNPFMEEPSKEVLLVVDFLDRFNLVEPGRILVHRDSIDIFGFEDEYLPYFDDNQLTLTVYPSKGDIWINVENESDGSESDDLNQVHDYIKNLSEKYSIFYWAIDGEPV
jgi:hypothetical protein